jgi:hypothetical protein
MEIIDFYYEESDQELEVRFSTSQDEDYYRVLKLSLEDAKYYAPMVIEEEDLIDGLDEEFVLEILESYYSENSLGSEELL